MNSNNGIRLTNTTTGSDTVLTAPLGGPLNPIPYGDFDPKLSPDGAWGVWMRHVAASEWHIIKATIPGDLETDLSSPGAGDTVPNWSSDQLKIIFGNGLANSLVTMNPDGSGRTSVNLAANRFYAQPDFYPGSGSSSAAKIVYERRLVTNSITVNTLVDEDAPGDGQCSLREAINNANTKSDTTNHDCAAGIGRDAILFTVSGTFTLGRALPMVLNVLTIDGVGQTITIDGANAYQVLNVSSAAGVTVNNLTIAHGTGAGSVAAINRAGGAIFNAGALSVTNVSFSGNSGPDYGGAIYNYFGTVGITNGVLSNNSATVGGAIDDQGGTLNVANSTFSSNTATTSGGGINNDSAGGTLTVVNSTFTSNSAGNGGGIFHQNNGKLTVSASLRATPPATAGQFSARRAPADRSRSAIVPLPPTAPRWEAARSGRTSPAAALRLRAAPSRATRRPPEPLSTRPTRRLPSRTVF